MYRCMRAWMAMLAGIGLVLGCGGGGGGGSEKTTVDLNGSYSYSLTPGTLSGNGASDCDQSVASTGTVDVTWTTGSGQCQIVIDGGTPITATVSGNTMKYSQTETSYSGCDAYLESSSIHMTSADAATGSIHWHCSWLFSGTTYTCEATDTLAITRL